MKRVLFAIFGTIAGLVGLLSFKTQTASIAGAPAAITTTGAGTTSSGSGSAAGSHTASSSTPPQKSSTASTTKTASNAATSGSSTKTATGTVVNTPYGPVEVRITVTAGKITKATAVEYPGNDPQSQQINYYAIPMLEKETVGKSTANIDMISGATYTSAGYVQSLQSALNKAGL